MSEMRVREEWQRLRNEACNLRAAMEAAERDQKKLRLCRDSILTAGRAALEIWDDQTNKATTKLVTTLEELMDLWEQGWR